MNKEQPLKLIRTICYLTCLGFFLAWLFTAVQNYVSRPTTTHVFTKYGDDNMKNAIFPSLTICKLPMEIGNGNIMNLWKGAVPCGNKSAISKPYFLSYLEACLEYGTNESIDDLVERVTYDSRMDFMNIQIYPSEIGILKSGEFKQHLDEIVVSNYHYHYGHCQTVDISSLSNNSGMFPMEFNDEKLNIVVRFYNAEFEIGARINQFYFLHDGTNINLLGKDVQSSTMYGATHSVSKNSI